MEGPGVRWWCTVHGGAAPGLSCNRPSGRRAAALHGHCHLLQAASQPSRDVDMCRHDTSALWARLQKPYLIVQSARDVGPEPGAVRKVSCGGDLRGRPAPGDLPISLLLEKLNLRHDMRHLQTDHQEGMWDEAKQSWLVTCRVRHYQDKTGQTITRVS